MQEAEDDNSRPVAHMPAGQGEPPVQGTGTEHPFGQRFHLRGDLAGICVSRLSQWRFRATYRWLAGQPNGSCRVFWDGVEQAVHKRQPGAGLVHHSDRCSQYSSTRYTNDRPKPRSNRLSAAHGIGMTTPWLRQSTAFSRPKSFIGPWRSFDAIDHASLKRVHWFNRCRLLEPIGNISHQQRPRPISTLLPKDQTWSLSQEKSASDKTGGVQIALAYGLLRWAIQGQVRYGVPDLARPSEKYIWSLIYRNFTRKLWRL